LRYEDALKGIAVVIICAVYAINFLHKMYKTNQFIVNYI